jgi:hypothetical protein
MALRRNFELGIRSFPQVRSMIVVGRLGLEPRTYGSAVRRQRSLWTLVIIGLHLHI